MLRSDSMKFILITVFFFITTVGFAQVNLTKGLVAYYPFNGNAKDESGNNNRTIFCNATLTSDKYGKSKSAYSFNGKNQFVRISNSAALNNMTKQITLSCRVQVNGFYQGTCHWNRIINKGSDYASGNYWLGFCDDAYLNVSACEAKSVDEAHQTFHGTAFYEDWGSGKAETFVNTGRWYNLTYTCDGSYNKLYVDCKLVEKWKATTNGIINNADLFFGKLDNPQYPYWFNGILDEVRIYNRALSTDEIFALCEKEVPKVTLEPKAEINYKIANCNKVLFNLKDITNVKSLRWEIDNLYTTTKNSFTYIFKNDGEYKINLTLKSDDGTMKVFSKKITIKKPVADFYYKNITNSKISFKAKEDKQRLNYTWNFGDGQTLNNIKSPIHEYEINGYLTVTLKVNDKNGCIDSISQTISIAPMIATKIIELNGENGGFTDIIAANNTNIDKLPEERINTLIREIEVLQDSIQISFYDNGTIDGDSITVLFNNKIITEHLLLNGEGKSFFLKIAPYPNTNELKMYAENLGTIPPNTALMIVYDGKKRYEMGISSNKFNNGMVSFVLKK